MSVLDIQGFDASYDWPTGAQAAALGYKACMAYITDPGDGNKGITQEKFNDLANAGLEVGFVWELGNSAVLNGSKQGIADAQRAQHNLNALSGPSHACPIFFAIDFDIQPAQYQTAADYFRGVAKVLGLARVGVYGHYGILSWLTDQKLVSKRWQTYAWSKGAVYKWLDVYQYENGQALGNGLVDYCHMNSETNWGSRGVRFAKPFVKTANHPSQPDPAVKYVVREGDNLNAIARKYNTSVGHIMSLNPDIHNENLIYAGESIRVK